MRNWLESLFFSLTILLLELSLICVLRISACSDVGTAIVGACLSGHWCTCVAGPQAAFQGVTLGCRLHTSATVFDD